MKEKFDAVGLTVAEEGAITAEDIDKKGLIDSHYGSRVALQRSSRESQPGLARLADSFCHSFSLQQLVVRQSKTVGLGSVAPPFTNCARARGKGCRRQQNATTEYSQGT